MPVLPRSLEVQAEISAIRRDIHAHPELGFEEEQASTWLAEALSDAGFAVAKGVYDLPTAFTAQAGSGPLPDGALLKRMTIELVG